MKQQTNTNIINCSIKNKTNTKKQKKEKEKEKKTDEKKIVTTQLDNNCVGGGFTFSTRTLR